MNARLLIGAVLAAVVMFFWGFVFWTLLPVSKQVMHGLPNEARVVGALQAGSLETGVYFYPWAEGADAEAMRQADEKHREGPVVEILYRAEGSPMMDPKMLAIGFLHFLASTILAGALLALAAPALPSFFGRWGFVFLFGLTASAFHDLSGPIWFYNPWDFAILNVAYHVVGWLLGGMLLAAIITPPRAKSAPA
jgi:hypothetical protein